MDDTRWRTQYQVNSRLRIVNKIMDTLKRHIPFSCPVGLLELTKIAIRYEEKVYTSGVTQSAYLRTISLKMLTMETRNQNNNNPMPNPLPLHPPNPVHLCPYSLDPRVITYIKIKNGGFQKASGTVGFSPLSQLAFGGRGRSFLPVWS
ncbi:hypothetical protein ACHQM5_018643 [Ranunculus cassubicifolius]